MKLSVLGATLTATTTVFAFTRNNAFARSPSAAFLNINKNMDEVTLKDIKQDINKKMTDVKDTATKKADDAKEAASNKAGDAKKAVGNKADDVKKAIGNKADEVSANMKK